MKSFDTSDLFGKYKSAEDIELLSKLINFTVAFRKVLPSCRILPDAAALVCCIVGHFGKHASDEEAGDFVDLTSASHCHRKMSLRHTYFRLFYHE